MKYRLLWACAVAGVGLHLAGISWDVYLHSHDSTLAAREGILTLSNPSHALIFAGMALTSASVLAVALAWMQDRQFGGSGKPAILLRSVSLPMVALAGVGSVWLASLAQDSAGHVHTAEEQHAHADAVVAAGGTLADTAVSHDHPVTAAVAAAITDNPIGEGAAHSHGNEVPVTQEQLAAALTFVNDVKANTAKYEDIRVAMAAGYVQLTQDLPAIAAHFVNLKYLSDGIMMDPTKPEFLLYTKRLDGNWRLVGTMFYQENSTESPPSYFGPLDAWHLHENLCFTGTSVRQAVSAEGCKGGLFVKKTAWQLHVWTTASPGGVFPMTWRASVRARSPGRRAPRPRNSLAFPDVHQLSAVCPYILPSVYETADGVSYHGRNLMGEGVGCDADTLPRRSCSPACQPVRTA